MTAKKHKKIAGFTLPELMVSMVIAAIVMGMALNVYVDMRHPYMRLSAKHEINTNQLIIKQIFYNAIGHSGFTSKYGDIYQELVDNSGGQLWRYLWDNGSYCNREGTSGEWPKFN